MSPRIPDTHAEAWALLPWLANGRIATTEREWVEAHVQTCAECRAELAAQRMISTQLRDDEVAAPAAPSEEQRSFDKLWARIEASEAATLPATGTGGGGGFRASRTVRWLAAAVIVQAVGLGVLGFSALSNDGGPASEFVTVTREDPRTGARAQAPTVRLVFAPQASIETINTLLAHQGLEIVGGPGTQGNFTAVLSADAIASGASAESVASVMSKDPNVSFAEPVAR
jgi:anti-sigma factor RsiW